ncbi:MAG: AmmeMemoRadiSam system radical SAM enzyme [Armatimonadetes bacterium]|nr:AmmeMemoRadiSam system radical SAM enzyme [Armatimonadota bacterium]
MIEVAPAMLWHGDGARVVCDLCPHRCALVDSGLGRCGVRRNDGGQLVTLADGWLVAAHAAPIERKPLHHVAPGSQSFSFAAAGCTLRCAYCQNWMISQTVKEGAGPPAAHWTAERLVDAARQAGCAVLAATFGEPTVFAEFALRAARSARDAGLLNVWKTNGLTTLEAVEQIAPWLDAVNVDLKGWDESLYRERLGGDRDAVLAATEAYHRAGVFVEVTTLLLPDQLDDWRELDGLSDWILAHLGAETPWHLSRYHPDYRLADSAATAPERLVAARARALAQGHQYVYTNAVPDGLHTWCPACERVIIERFESGRVVDHRVEGRCVCGITLPEARRRQTPVR